MLSSMRKTVGKAAYFDGGRGEEIFRGQLDQVMSQKLAESTRQDFHRPDVRAVFAAAEVTACARPASDATRGCRCIRSDARRYFSP